MADESQRNASTVNRMMTTLRELISALDRRAPHVDRPGELRIAREARMLRREAVKQLEALGSCGPDSSPYDQEFVDAIMTDDGSPPFEREASLRSSSRASEAARRSDRAGIEPPATPAA